MIDRLGSRRSVDAAMIVVVATLAVLLALLVVVAMSGSARADQMLPAPLRFEVADGGVLEVDGDRRYVDTLELRSGADAAVLVNELSLDDYVAGVAEMPSGWPMEALKAQAVAARTYALHDSRSSRYPGYDICATVACQVFRGADVVLGSPTGHRWREAVDATAGEVLLDAAGEPILARYYSTSGGRTYGNEEAFPSSGPRDYLVAFEDPFDEVSPLHRWTVTFSRPEFDDVLSRGETLASAVPVASAERVGPAEDPGAAVLVVGEDGTAVEVGAREFQRFVSDVAPRRFPDRFPGTLEGWPGLLPSTVPSSRFAIEVSDSEVVLHGQGWGHGVGLGQYGARGRADDGATHLDILSAYYNGLTPTVVDELSDRLRVGMPVDDRVRIRADSSVRILADGAVVEPEALGTWTVTRDGDHWALQAPEGHDAALQIGAARPAASLGHLSDAVAVEAAVNKPARLELQVTDEDGQHVLTRPLGIAEAGTHAAVWRLDDQDGSLVRDGSYRLAFVGRDNSGQQAGTPLEITVPLDDPDEPHAQTETPYNDRVGSLRALALAVAVGALAIAGLLLIRRAR